MFKTAMRKPRDVLIALTLSMVTGVAHAELAICTTPQRPACPSALPDISDSEFTFSRLIFADNQIAINNLGDRIRERTAFYCGNETFNQS